MNRYGGFLEDISEKLKIVRGIQEKENIWYARTVYSISGLMGLASLWDAAEDNDNVSIQHFKHRVEKTLYAYCALYPEIKQLFPADLSIVSDEVYNIYVSTGHIYHSPNRIAPVPKSTASSGRVMFVRGLPVEENVYMSGLGTYLFNNILNDSTDVQLMFQLQNQRMDDFLKTVKSKAKWETMDDLQMWNYLRLTPPFKRGYWTDLPDKNIDISVLRSKDKFNSIYCLYRFENDQCFISQLKSWQSEKGKYRQISNAVLYDFGTLPATTYSVDGNIVHLHFKYLPPPSELNLIKLYSWPEEYVGLPHDFNRIMDKQVFFALKSVLEKVGYEFVEE